MRVISYNSTLLTENPIVLQTSLQLGSKLLKGFGVMSDDVNFLGQIVRDSMEKQAQETLKKTDDVGLDVMKPLQVYVKPLDSLLSSGMGG